MHVFCARCTMNIFLTVRDTGLSETPFLVPGRYPGSPDCNPESPVSFSVCNLTYFYGETSPPLFFLHCSCSSGNSPVFHSNFHHSVHLPATAFRFFPPHRYPGFWNRPHGKVMYRFPDPCKKISAPSIRKLLLPEVLRKLRSGCLLPHPDTPYCFRLRSEALFHIPAVFGPRS